MSVTKFRSSLVAMLLAALALVLLSAEPASAQVQAQAVVSFQQLYQVALLENNVVGNAAFLFTTNAFNADGSTSGTFAANVEGNLLQGRFMALNFRGESLWAAWAAGPDVALVARGWKTQDRLVGDATISLALDGQIARQSFFLYGQGVTLMAQAPPAARPSPSPLSAQPNTGPTAPNARPSVFAQP
jgi:hypothetical protein